MRREIIQLYPHSARQHDLHGLYLSHDLRAQVRNRAAPFVYANFVASLDGRIAIKDTSNPSLKVPEAIANDRDWRLFQELAAQADLIISSGRYLREWAAGRAQEILQIDDPRYADLRQWREQQGLAPQADIAIISHSLDFPLPEVLTAGGREVAVFTTAEHDPARVPAIEAQAGKVYVVSKEGQTSVDGAMLLQRIQQLGYRTVYSAAGPKILRLLLAGGALHRLYLTYAHRLLGGNTMATIVDGAPLEPPIDATLNTLYLDPLALDGQGQLFASYDIT